MLCKTDMGMEDFLEQITVEYIRITKHLNPLLSLLDLNPLLSLLDAQLNSTDQNAFQIGCV